jgi:hypothetical protein
MQEKREPQDLEATLSQERLLATANTESLLGRSHLGNVHVFT